MRISQLAASAAALALIATPAMAGYGDKDKASYDKADKKDIVEIAASDPQFSTLVTLVTEAGLVETLQGEGPFTVFAPTNDAFAAVPADTLAAVRADDELLRSVLTYHVLPGKYKAGDILGTTADVATVQGATVTADGTGDGVMVNNANVIAADVKASNGVVHVIDTVLLPPQG